METGTEMVTAITMAKKAAKNIANYWQTPNLPRNLIN